MSLTGFRSIMDRLIILTASFAILSACSTMSTKTSQLTNIPTPLPERPPTYSQVDNQEGRSTRTIIRVRQPIGSDVAIKKNLLLRLQQTLDRELGKLSIPVIDRQFDNLVQDEVELAEKYGKAGGRHDADVVLLLVLDSYNSETSASEEKRLFNRDKKYGECDYKSEFSGWIRAYEIPSMSIIEQWNIEESGSDSFEESHSSVCNRKFKAKIKELDHQNIDSAACKMKAKISNILAPTGYVLASEPRDDGTLLEISLGSATELKPGDGLHLYHETSGTPYGEVVVTKEISANQSYVKVKSLNKGESIYQSDMVRPYKEGVFNSFKGLSCYL